MVPRPRALTAGEASLVMTLAGRLGLDLGEIDVMRDDQGRLHVLDVNATPWGWLREGAPTGAADSLLPAALALEAMVEGRSPAFGRRRAAEVQRVATVPP